MSMGKTIQNALGRQGAEADNGTKLSEGDIHNVLRNERRRLVLDFLGANGQTSTLRELSEAIAEMETGESPPPRNIRDSVYASLHQTHLPMLDDLGIIEYDQDGKTVEFDRGAQDIARYTSVVSSYGMTWYQYYLLLGLGSLFAILGAELGVPVVGAIDTLVWALVAVVVMVGTAIYQIVFMRWPFAYHYRFSRSESRSGPE